MKKLFLNILLNCYPKQFRENYLDQIVDIYEQGEEVDMLDIITSLFMLNLKRISSILAMIALIPSTFFVSTNVFFYTLTNLGMPSGIRQLNRLIESPIVILGTLGLAGILSLNSLFEGRVITHNKTISVQFISFNKSKFAVSTLAVAIMVLGIITLYLFVENIGFNI